MIEVALVVKGLETRMLDDLAAGADGDQADIGHVPFPPVPFMEFFQRSEALPEG